MPTPHGARGGLAFSADELRVVRRALAEALRPTDRSPSVVAPRPATYVQDCLRLVEAVDDAVAEAARLRTFLLEELRRYRRALPGTARGYPERLNAALDAGYVPGADDLAALRGLRASANGAPAYQRRTALLRRCETLAENDVRLRLEAHMPAPRRLLSLPGLANEPEQDPKRDPEEKPKPVAPGAPGQPATTPDKPHDPGRRTPTPAEIWPPHRRNPDPDPNPNPNPNPNQARTA